MDQLLDLMLSLYGPTPYFVIFGILLLCGLGIPIPEDITLFVAGIVAYYGLTDLWYTIIVCYAGVMLGDTTIFLLGYFFGLKLSQTWFFRKFLSEERLKVAQARLNHKHGNRLIFLARFMPGLRAPIYFSAGTLHLPFRLFLFYDGLAALVSVPAIVGAIYYFGDEIDQVVSVIRKIEHSIVGIILLFGCAIALRWYWKKQKKRTRKALH